MEFRQEIIGDAERGAEMLVAEHGDRLHAAVTLLRPSNATRVGSRRGRLPGRSTKYRADGGRRPVQTLQVIL